MVDPPKSLCEVVCAWSSAGLGMLEGAAGELNAGIAWRPLLLGVPRIVPVVEAILQGVTGRACLQVMA